MAPKPENLPAAQVSAAKFRQNILREFPDYDNWTPSDFTKLRPVHIDNIRRNIGLNEEAGDWSNYIPKSFFREYGDAAYAVFMVTVHREADARNMEAGFAADVLRTVYGVEAGLSDLEIAGLRTDNQVNIPEIKRKATGPEILNHSMALSFAQDNTADITIPEQAAMAIVVGNPIIARRDPELAASVNTKGFHSLYPLAAAFDSGYMSGTNPGLSSNLGKFKLRFDPQQAAANMPDIVKRIFTPTTEDDYYLDANGQKLPIDPRTAWTAGNILAQMDVAGGVANDNNAGGRVYGVPVTRAQGVGGRQ